MNTRLTKQESFRFQRALYRLMLLCFLYGMGSISESDSIADPSVYQAKQKGFLEEHQTLELHELRRVAVFLDSLASIRIFEDTRDRGLMATCK
jgi:hypothetical protein